MIHIKPRAVTKQTALVTKSSPAVTKSQGRPRVHVSDAERQRAYRARRKKDAFVRFSETYLRPQVLALAKAIDDELRGV